MKRKKVVKHKIKWKIFLKLILIIAIIFLIFLIFKSIPIKHFVFKNNTFLTDQEILNTLNYNDDYPCLLCLGNYQIKQKLKNNPFIMDVKMKKSLLGEVELDITENTPLFYNRDKKKLVLKNGQEIDSDNLYGMPILTNYVPDSLYQKLINSFKNLSPNVITLISEIIYDPWKSGDVIIDETRFFLKMNDGNHVYVNTINIEKLNNYLELYATLEGKKGTLYLDSSSDKISFSLF